MNMLALAPTALPESKPLEFLRAAVAAKFDAVGIRLHRSPQLTFHEVVGNQPLIRDMKRTIADGGLKVLDILSFYLVPEPDFDGFKAAVELGREFGASYAMVIGADTERRRVEDNFGRFCDIAGPLGLTAVIEFVPFRELRTLPEALQVIKAAARPNAAICVDPLHFARSGGKPADLVGLDPKLFPYCQLSDGVLAPGEPDLALARRLGFGERKMPGEGSLPLNELLDALPANLPLSVEVLPPKDGSVSPNEWVRRLAESSRRFLAARAKAGRH